MDLGWEKAPACSRANVTSPAPATPQPAGLGQLGRLEMGRVREAGGRGRFEKCSRFRAPPTCSTPRRSARSTSPRCRRRCSRPGAARQRSHSVRGGEGTGHPAAPEPRQARTAPHPHPPRERRASFAPSPITLMWSHQSMPMVKTLQSWCPTESRHLHVLCAPHFCPASVSKALTPPPFTLPSTFCETECPNFT